MLCGAFTGLLGAATLPDDFDDSLVVNDFSQPVGFAFLPDGRVGLAYSYSWVDPLTMESRRSLMFRLGTWEDE